MGLNPHPHTHTHISMAPLLSQKHKAVNSATPDSRFTSSFQCQSTLAPFKLVEAPPPLETGSVIGERLNVQAAARAHSSSLIPSLRCSFITRHQNFQISGKTFSSASFLHQLAASLLDFTGLHHISKAESLYQQKRCCYTFASTLIFALRRQTNYSFLAEAPCARCRNQLTT